MGAVEPALGSNASRAGRTLGLIQGGACCLVGRGREERSLIWKFLDFDGESG